MNPAEFSPPAPAPKRSRSWPFWLIGPLALLVVGAIGIVLWSRDEPPPDLSDLAVVPRAIPDDQNAFLVLSAAAARVDESPWAQNDDLFYEMSRGKNWDPSKATVWLAANEHLWPEVSRAAMLRQSQAPIPKNATDLGAQPIGALRQFTQLASLRAWHLYRNGNPDEAVAFLEAMLHASERIGNANSGLFLWLMGMATNGIIVAQAETMALEGPISTTAGKRFILTMEATRANSASFANAIRNEHHFGKAAIDQVRLHGVSEFLGADIDAKLAKVGLFSLILKPNCTARLHANILRRTIGRIDMDWPSLNSTISGEYELKGTNWHRWNPNNRLGRALVDEVAPALETLLKKNLRAQSAISATQALLAVRLYEIEHGTLPEKLSDLVPKYLPAVPLDYFDRAPIRYSRAARAIWSAGKNALTAEGLDSELAPDEVVLRLPKPMP